MCGAKNLKFICLTLEGCREKNIEQNLRQTCNYPWLFSYGITHLRYPHRMWISAPGKAIQLNDTFVFPDVCPECLSEDDVPPHRMVTKPQTCDPVTADVLSGNTSKPYHRAQLNMRIATLRVTYEDPQLYRSRGVRHEEELWALQAELTLYVDKIVNLFQPWVSVRTTSQVK